MANNGVKNQQLQALLQQDPYKQLVKPDTIRQFKFLNDEKKQELTTGANQLWQVVSSRAPEEQTHKSAVEKLQALTKALRDLEAKSSQQQRQQPPQQPQQPQAGANRPSSQGQPANDADRGVSNINAQEVPEQYRRVADNIQWLNPTNMQAEPNYREELKKRYAEALFKHDLHGKHAQRLEQQAQQLRSRGGEVPETLNQQRQGHLAKSQEAKVFIDRVQQQQTMLQQQLKQQQQQQQSQQAARNANGGMGNANLTQQQQQQQQSMNQQNGSANVNGRPLPQNVSSDAIRQQQVNRPQTSGSHAHAPPSASSAHGNVPATPQLPQQQANFNTPRQPHPSGAANFSNSPQTSMPPSSAQPSGPVPYSHQGAIDAAAKSYSNNAPPQQPGVPGQFNGPSFNRPDFEKSTSRNKNWSISKDFKPSAPQAVPMPPSRPTLAGSNSGPMGSMGQPAIQQQPSYNLHGPGDRVLDKKKLDELVRQVCGGDGNGAQGLHPEVEESILQLADEFFDNVVSSACKLAKLRGSNQLEVRDIQLVLQKTYNIRIPGYSTDEVRTVRKVQPTASYLQKMNAVQAAKMTKTDL